MKSATFDAPRFLTDGEIKNELKTAIGDRRAELALELAERREYRATWTPDMAVGWQGPSAPDNDGGRLAALGQENASDKEVLSSD